MRTKWIERMSKVSACVSLLAVAACGSSPNGGGPSGLGAPSDDPNGGGNASNSAAGSSDSSSDPMAPAPPAPDGKTMVRVVHASSDAPQIDVYVRGNDTPILTGLAYGQTSTWIAADATTTTFDVRATPSTSTGPLVYTTGPIALPNQGHITAVAAGLLASSDAGSALRVVPLIDNYAGMVPGKARVRVLHAGADAPTVDLDVGNNDPTKPEVSGLARYADTGADGIPLDANTAIDIGIDAGGIEVTSFTTPKLPEGGDLLLIATGLLGSLARDPSGFALLAVGTNGNLGFVKQDPVVYALHASPDAPAVDGFIGENKIINGFQFGALSGRLQVSPGSYSIDVFAHADAAARPGGAPAFSGSTGALAAGERYLSIVTGFLTPADGTPIVLDTERDGFDVDATNAHLRAVHASPDAPAVDIGLVTGTSISPVIFPDLTFGSTSNESGFSTSAAMYSIGVAGANADTSIVAKFSIPTIANQRAFVVAAGALAPKGTEKPFRLAVVDTAAEPWTVTHVFPK